MSLNDTPSANRVHIGFFGRTNAGKSSLVNAITGQNMAIVSEKKGTTTDPVYKSMEILPLGPVVIIDTAGLDDDGELGTLRIEKTVQVLNKTDIAVVVVDAKEGICSYEKDLIKRINDMEIPYIVVYNKCDVASDVDPKEMKTGTGPYEISVNTSTVTGYGIDDLKNIIADIYKGKEADKPIVADIINPLDIVVLVVPIDESAPKNRLILPQQQVIRDVLDAGAISVVVKDTELKETLEKLADNPALVITDSQVFGKVAEIVPESVRLTSFSILMARWKGFLDAAVDGAALLDEIEDNDKILISEGCTHHRQCGDIGTVKLPNLIRKYTGKNPQFDFTSGNDYPEDLTDYRLVIHCGGCMLNERTMRYRMRTTLGGGVAFTNYGIAIAKMNGILDRSIQPLC
ncbi:MAG: [FeFe] hydrogenase H-cluster maturation GTPase HydF [Lachnospiraceae bacterium]|nr:[FeFe] hydrogenase H-cluster maturation GTPase HydF [Lachnospiraceae bacterium]